MALTKRIRFEILRRDQYACQYCGAKAPNVELTVDHVVPVALGGGDEPGNLLAACRDCNGGKASISPDAPLVKQVSDHAAAYALAMTDRMTRIRATLQAQAAERDYFFMAWNTWSRGGQSVPLPSDWKSSIDRWHRMGVPRELYDDAIEIAMKKRGLVGPTSEFAYMAGVIWGRINEHEIDYSLTAETVAVWTDAELRSSIEKARLEGYQAGRHRTLASHHPVDDILVRLIDRRPQHVA